MPAPALKAQSTGDAYPVAQLGRTGRRQSSSTYWVFADLAVGPAQGSITRSAYNASMFAVDAPVLLSPTLP